MVLPAALSLIVLTCLGLGFRRLVLAMRLQDMPLSRARSAAQGMVELQGTATVMPGEPIVSPLTRTPCVWWHYTVTRTRVDPGQPSSELVADETSSDCFHLVDASGRCIVDPVGARVVATRQLTWHGQDEQPGRIPSSGWDAFFTFGPYRFREQIIRAGEILLVQGFFRTQAALADQGEARDVADLLAEWKQDRRALLRRFDTNRDGEIDQAEWEHARHAALDEVHRRYVDQTVSPDLNIVGAPPQRKQTYVISAVRRAQLIRRYELQAVGYMAAAMFLTAMLAESLQIARP